MVSSGISRPLDIPGCHNGFTAVILPSLDLAIPVNSAIFDNGMRKIELFLFNPTIPLLHCAAVTISEINSNSIHSEETQVKLVIP